MCTVHLTRQYSLLRSVTSLSIKFRNIARMTTSAEPLQTKQSIKMALAVPDGVLSGREDRYKGITVDSSLVEAPAANTFANVLQNTLSFWGEQGRNTIWFKVETKHSDWIPHLTNCGFEFHHAREGFAMLYKGLTDRKPNIPPYSHTMVGVGGLVINDNNQILCITEKNSIIPGSWKLPGGYVELNESLVDAAVREVFEETGIQTKFDSVVMFRHALKGLNFDCADMYVVIALKPATNNNDIQLCPIEIANAEWMDFETYLSHPSVHKTNKDFLRSHLHNKRIGYKIECHEVEHEILKRKYNLYHVSNPDLDASKL